MPGTLFAKPTEFVNVGLMIATIVSLEVTGKKATGTIHTHFRGKEPGPETSSTGYVIPTPKGKEGIYLEVHFDDKPPYEIPPGAKRIIWYLKKYVDRPGRTLLFRPPYETTRRSRLRWR